MNIFVLLYNSGTDKEGIHSIELKGRTIVLMFEDKDDATRYCGLLEAQDFPLPTVEMINIEEIKDFCSTKYGVKFEIYEKVHAKGKTTEPYTTLNKVEPEGDVEWNFEKFLIGKDSKVIARFKPGVKPFDENLIAAIEVALDS